ncbi:MAG: hypothetical protein ACK5N8_04515 [Alphaproteobacteria bacterium]
MSTYKLQIKYNDVLWFGEHTGYCLIEYDNDGTPTNVYTVDLQPTTNLEDITFQINTTQYDTLDQNFFKFQDIGISGSNAIEIFNKIENIYLQ